MELRLKELLVWQLCLVLGNESRREGSIESVLHNLIVFAGAKQYTDCRLLMSLLYVTIKSLQVEAQFTEVLWFEPSYFEFKRDKTV